MDNLVNFLLEYYVWILGVLIIIIITIIGFLVDTKQKRKKKEKENVVNEKENSVTTVDTNVSGQPQGLTSQNAQVAQTLPNISNVSPVSSPLPNNSVNTTTTPLDNSQTQSVVSNSTLLNEQKPHFEPQPVANSFQGGVNQFAQNTSFNQSINSSVPKPVNAVSINQPSSQNVVTPQNNMQNNVSTPVNTQSSYNSNIQTPVNNGVVAHQNLQVSSQPVMQAQPTLNANSAPSQPVSTAVPNAGISFVTGSSNNSNDDIWKL